MTSLKLVSGLITLKNKKNVKNRKTWQG